MGFPVIKTNVGYLYCVLNEVPEHHQNYTGLPQIFDKRRQHAYMRSTPDRLNSNQIHVLNQA